MCTDHDPADARGVVYSLVEEDGVDLLMIRLVVRVAHRVHRFS